MAIIAFAASRYMAFRLRSGAIAWAMAVTTGGAAQIIMIYRGANKSGGAVTVDTVGVCLGRNVVDRLTYRYHVVMTALA